MKPSTSDEFTQLLKTSALSPAFPLGLFPVSLRPYMELIRLEKPTGTVLMFWPFAWSLTMSAFRTGADPFTHSLQLLRCAITAFIVRSSACTVNDIVDRDMDIAVGRTQSRPLPSGRISVRSALIFLFLQYIIGVVFICTVFSSLALWVALFQLLPLFAIYPFLKRFTHWPQAWLGVAMNFGAITAWTSSVETVDRYLMASLLIGCWCWTMLYDTIYACQDIEDDIKVGVRSTAILFGTWIRPLLVGCGLAFVATLFLCGVLNAQGWPYFVVSVGGTAFHLIWQFQTVDLKSPGSCWKNFLKNGQLGWIVWAGLSLDYLFSVHAAA